MSIEKIHFSYLVKHFLKLIAVIGLLSLLACGSDDKDTEINDPVTAVNPITISSHTPEVDENNVNVSSTIVVIFSEPIATSGIEINFNLSNSEGEVTGTSTISNTEFTFAPFEELDFSTKYTVIVSSDPISEKKITTTSWDFITEEKELEPEPVSDSAKPAETLIELWSSNFDDATAPSGITWGSQAGGTIDFSDGYIHATYPKTPGESYVWFSKKFTQNEGLFDVTIEFDARMSSENKHGLKFVKMFGFGEGNSVANVTFALDYTGIDNGSLHGVGYGDGTINSNDTQNLIRLDGKDPELVGRSYGTAVVKTPQGKSFASTDWGTDWHHFVMRFKYNSGNSTDTELPDGEIYVEIDGNVYLDAVGIYNRHWSNPRVFKAVSLLGWSQGNGDPFTIDYDNVAISTQ